ncbi:hypothetical protein ACSFA8_24480 [Variovorax sp. RT4R15]|uniref:hypothetical protein n=1 Tax=Variovorax sp. RT4R15 TaxID=3443737 RepID=UPI003F45EB31
MTKPCAASNCADHTSGFSNYCDRHKRALRRHGAIDQTGITVPELKVYRDRVAARRAKNPSNPAWELLEQRWDTVRGHAEKTLRGHAAGRAGSRYDVLAADHIRKLAAQVPPQDIIDTSLAMFVMRETRPQRFRSDRAFDFQLARRVRALTDANAGTYYDAETGKVKRVYRDILPGTLERLAAPLKDAFGVAGIQLAGLDERDRKKKDNEKLRLVAALKDME